jgi:hypothetical protein
VAAQGLRGERIFAATLGLEPPAASARAAAQRTVSARNKADLLIVRI